MQFDWSIDRPSCFLYGTSFFGTERQIIVVFRMNTTNFY